MFYCSGSDWYGTENKFGYNTSYCKADERFEFTSDNEYVYGHTVTLYPVSNGNLETKEIEESSLPGWLKYHIVEETKSRIITETNYVLRNIAYIHSNHLNRNGG